MEYDEADIIAVGDIPPALDVLKAMPERVVRTIQAVGEFVVTAVYGQETATSFDIESAVYAK